MLNNLSNTETLRVIYLQNSVIAKAIGITKGHSYIQFFFTAAFHDCPEYQIFSQYIWYQFDHYRTIFIKNFILNLGNLKFASDLTFQHFSNQLKTSTWKFFIQLAEYVFRPTPEKSTFSRIQHCLNFHVAVYDNLPLPFRYCSNRTNIYTSKQHLFPNFYSQRNMKKNTKTQKLADRTRNHRQ